MVTRLARLSVEVRPYTVSSRASSWSRPTIGARRPGTPRSASSEVPVRIRTSTGSAFPFRSIGPRGRKRNPRAARAVRSDTAIWSGSATCCSRAARFTASPVTMGSPGAAATAASTSPVFTPIRISRVVPWVRSSRRFTSSSRWSIRRAARRARAGSSSWAAGTPNAAITASPMNFSTVPPSASISSRMAAK